MWKTVILALAWLGAAAPLVAQDLRDEIVGYIAFEPYDSGIIMPAQLTQEIWADITFVDTRSAEQFDKETIPGARHIEWREIPARLEELPEAGKVILFCNTGALSAQAAFAARLLGRDNVVVLQGGFQDWQVHGAYRP